MNRIALVLSILMCVSVGMPIWHEPAHIYRVKIALNVTGLPIYANTTIYYTLNNTEAAETGSLVWNDSAKIGFYHDKGQIIFRAPENISGSTIFYMYYGNNDSKGETGIEHAYLHFEDCDNISDMNLRNGNMVASGGICRPTGYDEISIDIGSGANRPFENYGDGYRIIFSMNRTSTGSDAIRQAYFLADRVYGQSPTGTLYGLSQDTRTRKRVDYPDYGGVVRYAEQNGTATHAQWQITDAQIYRLNSTHFYEMFEIQNMSGDKLPFFKRYERITDYNVTGAPGGGSAVDTITRNVSFGINFGTRAQFDNISIMRYVPESAYSISESNETRPVTLNISYPLDSGTITAIYDTFEIDIIASELFKDSLDYCMFSLSETGRTPAYVMNTSPMAIGDYDEDYTNYVHAEFGYLDDGKSYYFNTTCVFDAFTLKSGVGFVVDFDLGNAADIYDWGAPTETYCKDGSLYRDYAVSVNALSYFKTEHVRCEHGCYAAKCRGSPEIETAILLLYAFIMPFALIMALDLIFGIAAHIMAKS